MNKLVKQTKKHAFQCKIIAGSGTPLTLNPEDNIGGSILTESFSHCADVGSTGEAISRECLQVKRGARSRAHYSALCRFL